MGSLNNPFTISRIAIIGAGPVGLATAKCLRASARFSSIVIFEQQDEVGGVWNYSPHAPGRFASLPQEDPYYPHDEPIRTGPSAAPFFLSPMYDRLHANIPGALMQYSDKSFPDTAKAFPKRELIQEYVVEYASDVRDLIRFTTQVTSLRVEGEKWRVDAKSTVDGKGSPSSEVYDAVVVCNGHYSVPHVPGIKGMQAFHEAHPDVICHSKQYRVPETFRRKKTIVVGNGPSGLDIALQINAQKGTEVLISMRTPTPADKLAHTGCEEIAEIEEFLPETRGVRLVDGRVESDIDAVVFCTGFLYSFPFLSLPGLISNGTGVHGLYRHLFHIEHPTLAFPGLYIKAIPFPMAESQGVALAAVWSNHLTLPPKEEMEAWSRALEEEKGGRQLHVLKPMGDAEYVNGMYEWVGDKGGRLPPRWGGEMIWMRRVYAEAKLRFEKEGCKAKTLGDLGLRFEEEAPKPDDRGVGA